MTSYTGFTSGDKWICRGSNAELTDSTDMYTFNKQNKTTKDFIDKKIIYCRK